MGGLHALCATKSKQGSSRQHSGRLLSAHTSTVTCTTLRSALLKLAWSLHKQCRDVQPHLALL